MKILVAGDFCPAGNANRLITEKKDFDSVLGEVKVLTGNVDYSIINFEAPIVNSIANPIKKCGPNLRTEACTMEALRWAGFNMVTLANNHILDYGEDGIRDTVNACMKYGIDFTGIGENLREASHVFYKQIGAETLAIINCCEHEFSIATRKSAGANPLDPIQQYRQIQEARHKADYVLVIVHGGHEHFKCPSPRMVETYRFFIDIGADAVVNHHQHCYSGYESYLSKPIFYGIGNLCFEDKGKCMTPWNEGYMVMINFDITGISFELFPYLQCNGDSSVRLLINDTKFREEIDTLNTIIANPEELEQHCKDFFINNKNFPLSIFEPYTSKYLRAAFYKGWLPSFFKGNKPIIALNHIMCESHRDKLIYLLKNKK